MFSGILLGLHGFLGQASDWNRVLPAEIDAFHFDLFSLKPSQTVAFSFDSLGRWVNATARKMGPGPRVIVGYSLGGRIALHSLTQTPDLWSAAIIVSAHPGLSDETERKKRIEADEVWAKRFEESNWAQVTADWNSQAVLKGGSGIPRREADFSRKALADSLRGCSLGKQEDLREKIRKLTLPILWIVGQDDQKFLTIGKEVERLNSRISLATIPKAGHRVPWDQPELFKKRVAEFLEGIPSGLPSH